MKILIYTHEFPPFTGGLATTSFKLAQGISARGHDVLVLAPYYPELINKSEYTNLGFKIIRMSRYTMNHGIISPIKELLGYFYLRKTLFVHEPDRLILITREAHFTGGLNLNYPGMIFARVAGYEAYRYLLGNKFYKRVMGMIMKRFYMRCQKIVCPSDATKQLMIKAGIPEKQIEVIYNGVDPKFLTLKPDISKIQELKNKHSISDHDFVILTVSRLVSGKGQDQTLKALHKVNKKFDKFKYLLVGEGLYEKNLRELAYKLNINSKVIFAGSVPHEEVIHYFDLCDIFVIANREIKFKENVEGLPNVVLEALSRGKPVISGTPGGAKEVIEDGNTGYIIDANNVDEIADKILNLLNEKTSTNETGSKGRVKIEKNFTENDMINKYIQLLSRV